MAEKTDLTENEKLAFYTHLSNIAKAQKAYVLGNDWDKTYNWRECTRTVEEMVAWVNLTIADKVYQAKGEQIKELIRERGL